MPPITKNLLIINVLLFLATYVLRGYGLDLTDNLGLHFFMADDFNITQLVTYMFMHANLSHLFFNMFAVWMFGRILEQVWGPKRFLIYYLVCGIGAGLIQEGVQYVEYATVLSAYDGVQMENTVIPMQQYLNLMNTVGASGAVYGILLAFGMLFPNQEIYIFPLPIPIKAKFFVVGYAAIELVLALSNNVHDNVAHFAHLGGMLFGVFMILYWKKKYRNNGTYFN